MQHVNETPEIVHPKANCLIVEDSDFDSRKMMRVVNRSHQKMRVEVAATLKAARVALARGDVTLILLDNNLPDGLGANFALEIAQDERLARIPVIMVSDWPSPFMWQKAASAGVIYVLNKSEFDAHYVHAALKVAGERRTKPN
jgi:DNA-binding response OmpR family regulator